LQVGDPDLLQTLFPFDRYVKVFVKVDVVEHNVGTLRDHFLPVLAAWIGDRRLDHAEIAAVVVGANVKEIAIVVRIVFDILFAGFDDFPFRHRLIGGNVTSFAGGVAAGEQQI